MPCVAIVALSTAMHTRADRTWGPSFLREGAGHPDDCTPRLSEEGAQQTQEDCGGGCTFSVCNTLHKKALHRGEVWGQGSSPR